MESSPRQPRDLSLACGTVHLDAEAADRRMERLMSRRKQTTWPWSGVSLFPSGPATGHVC